MRDDDDDDDDDGDAPAALAAGPIDAGPAADYDKDGLYDKLAKEKQILIMRKDGKLYALTSVCTHKKFLVKVKDGQYFCPKHSSRFARRRRTRAQAKRPHGRRQEAAHSLRGLARRQAAPDRGHGQTDRRRQSRGGRRICEGRIITRELQARENVKRRKNLLMM